MPQQDHLTGTDADLLLEDPWLYFWRYEQGRAMFVEMDREAFQRSIFLDARISPASDRVLSLGLDNMVLAGESLQAHDLEIGYIFHVAHCGSTLLARALEINRSGIVYREPLTLRQMSVNLTRSAGHRNPPDAWLARLKAVTSLMRRPVTSGPVLVKANVPVNFIIPHLMNVSSAARGIVLYATLENYLLSILRTDRHKQWVETIFEQLGPGIDAVLGTSPGERQGLTREQAVACLWRAQMALFVEALDAFGNMRSLDAEVLFARAPEAVRAAGAFFGDEPDRQVLDRLMESELFTTYSKQPGQHYGNAQRVAEQARVRAALGGAVEETAAWLSERFAADPLPARLGAPLLGESPDLMPAR